MQNFTQYNPEEQRYQAQQEALILSSEAKFFTNIYIWMFSGLLVTTLTAFTIANFMPQLIFKFSGSRVTGVTPVYWLTIIGTLGFVFFLSSAINKISAATAKSVFILYSVLTGAMFTGIVLFYPPALLLKTLAVCSLMYGSMAAYGLLTKRSLQGLGSFLFMGLIGIIIASIINIFTKSAGMQLIISYIGVLIFAGLTAYDHQKLRVMHASGFENDDDFSKTVIMGALTLYLDFINLFLFLLRIFSSRN